MAVRRVCALVVPALVAGGLALPAGAATTASASSWSGLVRPDGVVLELGPQGPVSHRSPGEVLGAVRRHGDRQAVLRALADAAVAAGQPAPLVVPAQQPEPAEAETVTALFAMAVPGGDLDGDGLVDVLTYVDDGGGLALQARRGTDGTELWSLPLDVSTGALAFPLGRDLTGDGADDLVLDELSFTGTESESETPTEYRYSFTGAVRHGYGVVSGPDGTTAWSTTVEGMLEESFSYLGDPLGLAGDAHYRLTSTNLAVLAPLSEDATGDGLPDLAISEIDLDVDARGTGAGVFLGPADAFAGRGTTTVSSTTRGRLVAGGTGEGVAGRTAEDQSGVSVLMPVGQVVGSPLADLAWVTQVLPAHDQTCIGAVLVAECLDRSTGTSELTLELLEGGTGRTAWASGFAGAGGFVSPAGADLDGDGTDDLALSLYEPEGSRLALVSGAGGGVLWDARGELFAPDLVGVPDDAGAPTAVLADVTFGDGADGFEVEVVVARRDAATGAVRSTSRHRVPVPHVENAPAGESGFVLVGLGALADGDGDGGRELAVFSLAGTAGFDEDFEVVEEKAASSASYSDLATGRVLLEESSDDLRLLLPSGDLDGDGLTDLQRQVYGELSDEAASPDSTGLRLADGRELWSVVGELPTAAGDQDGRPGDELLSVRGESDPQLVSLAGADLRERWRAGVHGRR